MKSHLSSRKAVRRRSSRGRQSRHSAASPAIFGHTNEGSFFSPAPVVASRGAESAAKLNAIATPATGLAVTIAPTSVLRTGGQPLPANAQTFFSARLGHDLSDVRIHSDAEAVASAKALRAQAYTVGEHIVFAAGKYAPHTDEGRRLLSHELVHVLQQRRSASPISCLQFQAEEGAAEGAAPTQAAAPASQEKEAAEQEQKNAAPEVLPDFTTAGRKSRHTDFVRYVQFKGQTDAEFDGGTGQTKNLKGVPAKGCEGCPDSECFSIAGTLEITYHVSTAVTLPEVPSGLTPCQEKRVREAIDTKIAPHEDQHVSAFGTYNGTVKLPINYKGCKDGLADFVQALHDKDAAAREATARAKSAALDPFHVNVDLDCEEPPPPKK